MSHLRKLLICLFTIVMCLVCNGPIYAQAVDYDNSPDIQKPTRVKLLTLVEEVTEQLGEGSDYVIFHQYYEAKVLSGNLRGTNIIVRNSSFGHSAYKLNVKVGDRVLVILEHGEDGTVAGGNIYEIVRDHYLAYITALFIAVLILIGGRKGVKSLISLIFTGFVIIKIMLPSILRGNSPVLISVGVSIVITGVTFLIISGFNKKTLCAVIGTSCGVIFAGAITFVIGSGARLTGLGMEETQMLQYIPQQIDFNYQGLLFAGILLGTLGAAMDVGMSIASSVEEIHKVNPEIHRKSLIKAGMNVGKDIMGTMANTLILAYAGASIPLILLFMAYNVPLVDILNRDFVATEVIRSLAGSLGLFLTVPVTAFVSGSIEKNNFKSNLVICQELNENKMK
jgi:uncharacterized membrane protein